MRPHSPLEFEGCDREEEEAVCLYIKKLIVAEFADRVATFVAHVGKLRVTDVLVLYMLSLHGNRGYVAPDSEHSPRSYPSRFLSVCQLRRL
jgi:hypothetical protein